MDGLRRPGFITRREFLAHDAFPDIVTRNKKIEGKGHGFLIGCAAVQGVEIRNAFGRQVNNLGINNQRLTEPSCFLYNTRIAFDPVSPVHRVKANAILADMDLKPIAVVLQLVRPAWPDGGCLATTG